MKQLMGDERCISIVRVCDLCVHMNVVIVEICEFVVSKVSVRSFAKYDNLFCF